MSAILSADDLNDFISPGVACIKPVETLPTAPPPPSSSNPFPLEHEVILDGQQPHQQTSQNASAPAQISLTDCLACSGCVTSAEAVLVSLQSHSEVLSMLDAAPALRLSTPTFTHAHNNIANTINKPFITGLQDAAAKLFVASVSPQTRAALAAASGGRVTEAQAGRMIEQLLAGDAGLASGGRHGNAFTWVVDTNAAREACLVLGADEVISRQGTGSSGGPNDQPVRPVLTSSCPGWVCYAEKTHPYVLPHLSRVKSPQALMGTLLKTTLSRVLRLAPDRIWHLAVMPCFDKKLEASREELTDAFWEGSGGEGKGVRDVDCVITTKEVLMLAESRGIDFFGLSKESVDRRRQLQQPEFPDPVLQAFLFPTRRHKQQRDAGTSGGNLHFILHDVQSRHPGSQIQTTRGRNADVVEYAVVGASGEAIFKAARYYGFRNIQNLVRKLKPARPSRMPGGRPVGGARRPAGKSSGLEYAYVEVMACPGGCTNGGGQIKVDDPIIVDRKGYGEKPGPDEQKAWLAAVDEAYFSAEESDSGAGLVHEAGDGGGLDLVAGISPSHIRDTLAHWADIMGIDVDTLAYTSFREVVSDVGKQTTDTERVLQLASKIGGGW